MARKVTVCDAIDAHRGTDQPQQISVVVTIEGVDVDTLLGYIKTQVSQYLYWCQLHCLNHGHSGPTTIDEIQYIEAYRRATRLRSNSASIFSSGSRSSPLSINFAFTAASS